MSRLLAVIKKGLGDDHSIQSWILENAQYITMMGSRAYDTYTESSDYDLYGFTIPPKDIVFPYHHGFVFGFHKKVPNFDQLQKHGMIYDGLEVDIQLFNIVKYFRLLMENNPNMVDSLFTKQEYVLKSTKIGEMVRVNRRLFLHKGAFFKFKGYAWSQLIKAKSKSREGKRKAIVDKFGYDVKFAGHIIRLLDECEQILQDGDVDLTRACEQIKAVNRGEMKLEEIEDLFKRKEKYLETLYEKSELRHSPDVDAILDLLLRCLEEHFGNIDELISRDTNDKSSLIRDIEEVLTRHR